MRMLYSEDIPGTPTLEVDKTYVTDIQSTIILRVKGNGFDDNEKLAIRYRIYKDGIEQPTYPTFTDGGLNIKSLLIPGTYNSKSFYNSGYIPFTFSSSYSYNYFYLFWFNISDTQVTIKFSRSGHYKIVFDLVKKSGGSDLPLTHQGRRVGGKNAVDTGTVYDILQVDYDINI